MKSYVTSGIGAQQTLTGSQDEKVAVYQTLADAEADLANLEAGQIVATPDTGDENAQPVDAVTDGDMHAVTSNAVFDTYAVISASSTVITGKPISQRSVIKIMFTSAISGSNTTTAMSISYNGTSYPVKIGKNGSLANFTASEISSGTYRYLQAYTTLELAFDGTQFIIIGNPVVLSSADYTIYADGKNIIYKSELFYNGKLTERIYVYKYGKVISIQYAGDLSANMSFSDGETISNLPSEYAPKKAQRIPIRADLSGLYLTLNTSGNLTFTGSMSAVSRVSNFQFYCTYIQ